MWNDALHTQGTLERCSFCCGLRRKRQVTESEQTILDASQYLGEIKNLGGYGLNKQSIIPWEHTRLLPQKHPYSQHSFKVRQLYNKGSCYWEPGMPCLGTGKLKLFRRVRLIQWSEGHVFF